MNDLFDWMKEARTSVHPLVLGSVFHYEFVFIHPFSDGNGRMARLWHTAILSKWKPVFEYIPIESQIEKFQEEYYLDDISVQISEDSESLSEYIKKLMVSASVLSK